MRSGMPKAKPSKVFQGLHARLVFPDHRDEAAVLDLTRRFSSATRFAYRRLLEGKTREELKRESGPLCALFGLNTRYADGGGPRPPWTPPGSWARTPARWSSAGESSLSN